MANKVIQQAAFVPVQPLRLPLHTLSFPAAWRAPIDALYTGGSEHTQRKERQVPIGRLNALIATAAPDIVSVARRASFDESEPWLYAHSPFPLPVLRAFIAAWLHDLAKAEHRALVPDTLRSLNLDLLRWKDREVDLLEQTLTEGGTSLPSPHLYVLLPDVLAAHIAAHTPYTHNGEKVRFHQVATNPVAGYAELMSWPPNEHRTGRGGASQTWYYSGTIKIALRTVPFDPVPRIHVYTGIRRWAGGQLNTKGTNAASVYLRSTSPLVRDAPTPARFAVAKLQWSPRTRDFVWRHGGPEEMLTRVAAIDHLPDAEQLAKKADAWIHGRDGVTVAVTHHTTMGGRNHPVGNGMMPAERSRIIEWVAEALAPHFELAKPLRRVTPDGLRFNIPARVLKTVGASKDRPHLAGTELEEHQQRQRAAEQARAEAQRHNALVRRSRLAAVVPEADLCVFLLYQDTNMRERLLVGVENLLGLTGQRQQTSDESWRWCTDDFTLRIHARQVPIGGELGEGSGKVRKGTTHDQAVAERRQQVKTALDAMVASTGETARLAIIELEGKERFKVRTTDPKFAIRLGCADAGMVSQFIEPANGESKEEESNTHHRVEAAWEDGFRQLGMRFVPIHTVPEGIPDNLNQLAFWVVKRRDDDINRFPLFVPIALLIRPHQDQILGKAIGMSRWVSYPELLLHLAGINPSGTARNEAQQQAELAGFIRTTIRQFGGDPTLVVTLGTNIRYRWPTMQNAHVVHGKIGFGDAPLQRASIYGKRLRFVRVCTSDRLETAQWWAPGNGDTVGLSKGLWTFDNQTTSSPLVFYSTVGKSGKHKKSGKNDAKLTSHYLTPVSVEASNDVRSVVASTAQSRNYLQPETTAWNPELLEFVMVSLQEGDDPTAWASYLHQQRLSEDYDEPLRLPLILHLAALATRYAIPAEDDRPEEAEDDDIDRELVAEQLTFDFGI